MCIINRRKSEIRINITAEMNVSAAPIGMKRRLYITVLAYFRKHFAQQLLALFMLGRARIIKLVQLFEALFLFRKHALQEEPDVLHRFL